MVGLLGGAFDPPHNGHVELARAGIRHFDLARLVVLVTGRPPHKTAETPPETRCRLAAAAFSSLPKVELSRFELDRDEPSYTVDTARWAASTCADAVFLVGADEFGDFLSWREPDGVLEWIRLGVATRPGYPHEALASVLAGLARPDRVEFFEIPALPISSREIRTRVSRGEPVVGLVPDAVGRLISELGLYGAVDRRAESELL